MSLSLEQLRQLEERGWRLTRDGSTSTAYQVWDDPDDPESGWEVLVLHTSGHGGKLTVNSSGSGLTERLLPDAAHFHQALSEAMLLLAHWSGELTEE